MSDEGSRRKIEARRVTIKMIDGSLIRGKINLQQDEAIIQRASEIFTRHQAPFVVIFEATFEGMSDRVIVINKHNILWVSPDE
jgi:D-alanine-D-alanine ligase-like ATP-grasp enzyme